jgi:hypothetical protein
MSEIFDSIVPAVGNSLAWQTELVAAQKHILAAEGEQAGQLRKVLAHLSYAKHRQLERVWKGLFQ